MSKPKRPGNEFGVRSKYCARIGQVVETGEETLTQQHFKEACDINNIARSIEATGSTAHVKQARERYGDFSDVMETALNFDKAIKAKNLFEQVPVEIRKKVGHSIPGLFEYISKPENFEECVKWGIYDKPAADSKADGSMKKPKVLDESPEKDS